jgi:hypothetical protein
MKTLALNVAADQLVLEKLVSQLFMRGQNLFDYITVV